VRGRFIQRMVCKGMVCKMVVCEAMICKGMVCEMVVLPTWAGLVPPCTPRNW
jgi:hypothetical protein